MTRLLIALFALLALAPTAGAQTAPASADAFVRVSDGHFVRNGQPYYYVGANLWYGMNLGSTGTAGDRARLVRELDRLQAIGVRNLRVTAMTEGPADQPFRVHPASQTAPGQFDEQLLEGLDFLLAEMGTRDMTGVLVLTNFFQWSGGMAQYHSWSSGLPIPYPDFEGHTWHEFQTFSSQFYVDDAAMRMFDDMTRMLVMRRNTVTGTMYRDDPTIMAWQLGNEPRGYAQPEAYVLWVDRAAGLLQMLDPNHLVSVGGEGKLSNANSMTQFDRVSRSPNIDYLTAHIWIENWGWYDPDGDAAGTFPIALGRAAAYLGDHVAIASDLGKPLVIEEFGASRDGGDYDPAATTVYRDTYYRFLYEAIARLAENGRAVSGSNFWSWGGEARPRDAGTNWRTGDPFIGDPPHEKQGWYSTYDGDATEALIQEYAARMATIDPAAAY